MKSFGAFLLSPVAGLIVAASVPTLHASLQATDDGVPSTMDLGGTSADPAQYIMGYTPGYTRSVGAVIAGWSTSYNSLIVQSGANIDGEGTLWTGVDVGADYNSIVLTGSSTWNLNGDYLRAGSSGSNNSIIVENASKIIGASFLSVGDNVGNNNSLTIRGLGSSISVSDGLNIGNDFGGEGGILTLESGGLLKLDATYGGAISIATNNYIHFAGGFLAWKGDWAEVIDSLADSGKFKAWNGTEFVSISSAEMSLRYYLTNAEALAATGIDGLGGYTLAMVVPEPSTWALIGAGMAGLVAGMGRKRLAGGR